MKHKKCRKHSSRIVETRALRKRLDILRFDIDNLKEIAKSWSEHAKKARTRVAELEAAQEPRPMSEAPRDGTAIYVVERLSLSEECDVDLYDGWLPSPPVEGEEGEDDGHSLIDDAKVTAGIELDTELLHADSHDPDGAQPLPPSPPDEGESNDE